MPGWASCRSPFLSSVSHPPDRRRDRLGAASSPGAGFVNYWLREVLGWFGIEQFEGPLNIYSFYGLLLVYTVYQVPYAFMLITAGLRNIDPALEEASRVSGAGLLRTLRKVTLPAVMPSIAGAVLLMAWSGFGLVSIPLVIGTGANIHVLSEQIVRVLADFPPDEGVAIGLSAIMIAFVAAAWIAQVSSCDGVASRRSPARASARRPSASARGGGRSAVSSSSTWALRPSCPCSRS